MLHMKLKDEDLFINGKFTYFRMTYEEMNKLGELLSHAFSLVYIEDENGEEKCLENMNQYDDSNKKITLEEIVTNVEDDEIDTDYYITLNDKSMVIHRFAEWMPNDLESIFFRLCKEALHTFATNYHIYYNGHCYDDMCEFHKNDSLR